MIKSAGILLYKIEGNPSFFLVHPGGPYFRNKELGAWTVPKGEFDDTEDPLDAAKREFKEETGSSITGKPIALNPVKQKGGKLVYCWAVEGDIDAEKIVSNTFKVEWPYRSGKWQSYPEVDKAAWFTAEEARVMINPAQVAFIDEVLALLEK
jgi:predicted NUDIX family NTP pyrophosphohydrolase